MIPNLPTDNLYKFIALSGLIVMLFSIYILETKTSDLEDKVYATEIEQAQLTIEIKALQKKTVELNEIVNNTINEHNECSSQAIDQMVVRYSDAEIKKMINDTEDATLQINLKVAEKKITLKRQTQLINQLRDLLFLGRIYIWFGFLVSIFGFTLWYYRVQRPLDTKLRMGAKQETD
ncbi:MAG: hypothetical protein JAY97_11535 [Candidatus Thiodiazotropha sp. 'RUGA']|nr:hypothetical protein [Candidatus Thiodiazotropha sp. 'RUGA']